MVLALTLDGLAHKISLNGQLAMAAVNKHQQLHALRATVIASTLAAIRNGTVSPVTLAPMPYWWRHRDESPT